MASFTWTPDFGAPKASRPKVTVVKFGDGYEQRVAQGINTNLKTWSLRFNSRTVADIDAIEAFLDARGAQESFDWVPMRASTAIKVICRDWTRTIDNATYDSLTATFEEVQEP